MKIAYFSEKFIGILKDTYSINPKNRLIVSIEQLAVLGVHLIEL